MEVVAETPSKPKKAGKHLDGVSFFFFEKVKTLLCRTRNAIKVFPDADNAMSVNVLDDLDAFADVRSLDDVCGLLGGKKSLASKLFLSVIDDDEEAELEVYASLRRAKKDMRVIEQQIHSLVDRAQALADHVQTSSDPLIAQLIALNVEERDTNEEQEHQPDETGTGASVENESTALRRGRSAKKKTTTPMHEKKTKDSDNPGSKRNKSTSASGRRKKSDSGSGGRKNIKANKEKNVDGKQGKGAASSIDDEAVEMESDDAVGIKPIALSEEDVAQMLKDAEKDFESLRSLHRLQVAQLKGPPNVEKLINDANLIDLECLHRVVDHDSLEGRLSIQMWWCIATKACKIRGVFNLIRSQKSKAAKIQERYNAIVMEKLNGNGLHFAQASNYDRLGKFLSQFPLFLFQSKWVTLRDWFQKVGDSVLLDRIVSIAPLSSVFFKDAFALHTHGFQLVDVRMNDCISNELIELCKSRVAVSRDVVFNSSEKVNPREKSSKRRQLSVDKIEGESMLRFKTTLIDRLCALFPGHKVDSMVSLLSEEGCQSQLAHTDYSPDALKNVASDDKMPLACLVALTDGNSPRHSLFFSYFCWAGTLFDVWPEAIRFDSSRKFKHLQIKLQAGDVLVFRGDLVHGGAAVKEANVRIHAYMEVIDGYRRPKHSDGSEETYFMYRLDHILKRKQK
jgi:hypothetical protein